MYAFSDHYVSQNIKPVFKSGTNLLWMMFWLRLIGAHQESKPTMGSECTKRSPHVGQEKAKKIKREDKAKSEEKKITLLNQLAVMLKKGVEQLNTETEMFSKQ